MKKIIYLSVLLALFNACTKKENPIVDSPNELDITITIDARTARFYNSLKIVAENHNILIGHQATSIAGAEGWRLWQHPQGDKSVFLMYIKNGQQCLDES